MAVWTRSGSSHMAYFENTISRGSSIDAGSFNVNTIGGSQFLQFFGDMAELCFYSSSLTPTDISNLFTNYMQQKWGL